MTQNGVNFHFYSLVLTIKSLRSISNSLAILLNVGRSGCVEFVHHLDTVTGLFSNSSASHLLVFCFSANTAFSRFKVSISKIKVKRKDSKISGYDKGEGWFYRILCCKTSFDGVGAVLATAAAGTVLASPDAVKLLTGGIYQGRLIGQDSGLKIAAVAALHTYSGSCQVGRANVGSLKVKYNHLEMDSRT